MSADYCPNCKSYLAANGSKCQNCGASVPARSYRYKPETPRPVRAAVAPVAQPKSKFGKGLLAGIAVAVLGVVILAVYGFHGGAQASSGAKSDSSSAATLAMLPNFGEGRSELQHRLAPYKIDWHPPDTTPPAYYRFRVGDDLVRLSFIYATRRDGSDVLSGVYIQHDNIEGAKPTFPMTLRRFRTIAVLRLSTPCCPIVSRCRFLRCLRRSSLTRRRRGRAKTAHFLRVRPQRAMPSKIPIGTFRNSSGWPIRRVPRRSPMWFRSIRIRRMRGLTRVASLANTCISA